jgi:hypothetical protein
VSEAVNIARGIGDENAQSDALAALSLRLAETGAPEDAVTLARALPNAWLRTTVLARMTAHLPEPRRSETTLFVLSQPDLPQDEDTWARFVPGIPDTLVPRVLATLAESPLGRALMSVEAIGLLSRSPEPARTELSRDLLEAARSTHEDVRFVALVPHAQGAIRDEALKEALSPRVCASAAFPLLLVLMVQGLTPQLPVLPRSWVFSFWKQVLHALRTPPLVAHLLPALTPVLRVLGGDVTVTATAKALVDASRMFP